MNISDIKGLHGICSEDTIKDFLKNGGYDYTVFQDTSGNLYSLEDEEDKVLSPLFSIYLCGLESHYPTVEEIRNVVEQGFCLNIRPSLKTPPSDMLHNASVWDNYYIDFKENMWADTSTNRRRKVNKLLNGAGEIRELKPTLKGLYDLAYNYWVRTGVLFSLEFFRFFLSSHELLNSPTWLGLYEGDNLLGLGHFSVNSVFGQRPVFAFNQYMSVNSKTSASEFLLKSGYFLAEKHGDIIVDTTYRCDYGDIPTVYEYKRQISNHSMSVYGMFYKPKDRNGAAPPFVEI